MKYPVQTTIGPKLHCETKHYRTGKTFTTDLPVEIGGTGESFSPVEVLCGALCSCMLSMLQYTAKTRGIELPHASAHATPEEKNHKITGIQVRVTVPGNINEADRAILEEATAHCPVKSSLSSNIVITTTWDWQ